MEKDVKKYSLYLIAIVAIVAVVGIVVMTTNYDGFSGTTSEDVLTSDNGEGESVGLAGQAYTKLGCNDPDGSFSTIGDDQYKQKSTVTYKTKSQTDYCKDGLKVVEYRCTTSGKEMKITSETFTCTKIMGNYHCEDGACVPPKAPTCTPGPTGKGKCVNEDKYIEYKKEYQNTDCTTYLNNLDQQYCGWNDDSSCKDNVGCCKESEIFSECQGNTLYNQTKNSCTGELKDNYKDCTKQINWFTKQPNVCSSNQFITSCVTNCNEGDVVYSCQLNSDNKLYQYMKGTCKVNQNVDYYSKSWIFWDNMGLIYWSSTCPAGATCYNPEGKCA